MRTKNKTLSVIIPNYNHAQYLSNCLISVLREAPENSEIIVIDDCSTDHSIDVIFSIMKNDNRIRLYRNKINKGVNRTVNYGLSLTNGEYVFGLSADDQVLPGFFSKALNLLQKEPSVQLCSSDYAYFYEDCPEKIIIEKLLNTKEYYHIFTPEKTLELFYKTKFWIPGHTTIIRTDIARQYSGYNVSIRHFSDFFLVHKIALHHPIAYIPEGLSAMRITSHSYSAQIALDRKLGFETVRNLFDLILQDNSKKLFQKSTLLSSIIKNYLIQILINPKYWGFLCPVIRKKIRKMITRPLT